MDILFEICLVSVTISLIGYNIFLKKTSLNAESLNKQNEELKDQINKVQTLISQNQSSTSVEIIFLKDQIKEKNNLIESLESRVTEETEKHKKILSQKKSSEVRLGNIAETLAPFLDQFNFEPEQCTFLGKPIDYISFGDEEITFIEIKSGKSQLNTKQRHIRDQVKAKLINWKEIRIT